MKITHAVPQLSYGRSLLLLLGSCAALLFAFSSTAAAAAPVVGKDGKVNACYRVKGKPKGAVRLVPAKQKKCRKGERRLAWNVGGTSNTTGTGATPGATGQTGATGATGSAGTNGSDADLQAKIASLTVKVEGLEGLLNGVTGGDLSGVLGKLQGVTGLELDEAIGAVPVVSELCDQTDVLTDQTNLLRTVIGGLGLAPALELIGLLEIPTLPPALTSFACSN